MKLAEALLLRTDNKKIISNLKTRMKESARIQEGDEPDENVDILASELHRVIQSNFELICKINKTNNLTRYDAEFSLAEAVHIKETVGHEHKLLSEVIDAACQKADRYARNELRYNKTIEVPEWQSRVAKLAQKYRQIDVNIQQLNWSTELLES